MSKNSVILSVVSTIALVFAATPSEASVRIIGKKFSAEEICPGAQNSRCVQDSTDAKSMRATRANPVTIGEDGKPMLDQYLGREFTTTMSKGLNYCGNVYEPNVIEDFAAAQEKPYLLLTDQNSLNLDYKAEKLIDLTANVDAAALAAAAGVGAADEEQVVAAIKLAFKRAKKQTITLSGAYEFWEINPAVTSALNAANVPDELQACRAWLEDGHTFTTSLTGFRINGANITSDMSSKFESVLTANLAGKLSDSQIAAISASFESTVEKQLELAFGKGFTLFSISHFRVR